MKLVYVAGAFRAQTPWQVEFNVRKAEGVALQVAVAGAVPVCPHTMYRFFDKSLPDSFWLGATLELLRKCDAIIMVHGWKDSNGACAERKEAESLGIPIFESPKEIETWIVSEGERSDKAIDLLVRAREWLRSYPTDSLNHDQHRDLCRQIDEALA